MRRKKISHFSDYFSEGGGGPSMLGDFDDFVLFPTFNLMGLLPSNEGEFNRYCV